MKLFVSVFFLLFCSSSFANGCYSKSDVGLLKSVFSSNNKDGLIALASDGIKKDMINDEVFKNKNSTLKNLSEITFAWGAKRNDGSATHLSSKFPSGKTCVWRVTFTLPKNIREQCDDDGAYGYFISFIKIGNSLKLNDFTSLYDVMDDGSLACSSANAVMMK
ncbi:sugar ABC transporter permease [Scandinavium sp. TWS1a]|uniref:sugar ABC transporter permease n=1 Tax=Scandinavium tedordense TaxID=2926521 RepID=UPI0021655DC6|nr:sugar ABC transporter permease [Scandinavium tedordense]MCS2169616.1 sugar ABC transporter permease [Scandinavium tedordense]